MQSRKIESWRHRKPKQINKSDGNWIKKENHNIGNLLAEFYQTSQGWLILILLKNTQNCWRGGNPWYKHHVNPQTRRRHNKKCYISVFFHEHRCEILNKMLDNVIQQHSWRMIHSDQVVFIPGMQGWYSICTSVNVLHYINKIKNKTHVNNSTYIDKTFAKIQKIQYFFGPVTIA